MATEIKRQRVRQGNFIDLPNLASGEFGYAVDQNRLFIGNTEITKHQSTAMVDADGFMVFNFGVDLDNKDGTFTLYKQSGDDTNTRTIVQSGEYDIDNLQIKIKQGSHLIETQSLILVHNSEIGVIGADQDRPVEFKEILNGEGGTLVQVYVDSTRSDNYTINYSIRTQSGTRIRNGVMKIFAYDMGETATENNYTFVEEFSQNIYPHDSLDMQFSINQVDDTFMIDYTANTSEVDTQITFVVERYKSNAYSI